MPLRGVFKNANLRGKLNEVPAYNGLDFVVVVVPVIVAVRVTVLTDVADATVWLASQDELLQEKELLVDTSKIETMCHERLTPKLSRLVWRSK